MKKQTHRMTTTTLFLASSLFFACNDPIKESILPTPDLSFAIIDGDTVKTRKEKDFDKIKDKDPNKKNYIVVGDTVVLYKAPKLHTPPSKDPDLSKLKNNDDPDLKGKPLRMVAIGGSLTAGVRDGGYFNEGILTSYPNLIARQMKLKKFEQPLFDAQDYNGFGRKVRTGANPTGGPVPKFKAADNNSGVEELIDVPGQNDHGIQKVAKLKKYKNTNEIDNWAVPTLGITALYPSNEISFYKWHDTDKQPKAYLNRVATDLGKSYLDNILNKKFDFFIYQMGLDDLLALALEQVDGLSSVLTAPNPNAYELLTKSAVYVEQDPSYKINAEIKFLKKILENKVKYAVFMNMPNVYRFPQLNIIDAKKVKEIADYAATNDLLYFPNNDARYLSRGDMKFAPIGEIDSLLSPRVGLRLKKGLTKQQPLSYYSLLPSDMALKNIITQFNQQTAGFGKYFNAPVVDLNTIYDKIIDNNYTSEEGLQISSKNFFSSDGIYPTALGQAVIANEVIKAMNSHYKMTIPLINLRDYQDIK